MLKPLTLAGLWLCLSWSLGLEAQPTSSVAEADFAAARKRMVEEQIRDRGIRDERLLAAMEAVPRHLFVPAEEQIDAYEDRSLPIGKGEMIHQPYVVALMTSLLKLDRGSKVLEVGTGSGYHAAVLGKLSGQVFSIEIDPDLYAQARANLAAAGVRNVHLRCGDGFQGWDTEAPFDAIILTAAASRVPQRLLDQLRIGGKLVVPQGKKVQELVIYTKTELDYERRTSRPVVVSPLSGDDGSDPR